MHNSQERGACILDALSLNACSVASCWYRGELELPRHAVIGTVLSLVMLLSLPTVRIHQLDVHLRTVHYARWVERNASAAHAALDSADGTVTQNAGSVALMRVEIEVKPESAKDVAIEPPVPLNRLLLRFKLSLRSSSDSDPLLF